MTTRPLPTSGGQQDERDDAPVVPLVPHPASRLFPPMTDDEFANLAKDIAEHGLEDDIVLLNGQILEGNHRYRACRETGIPPRFTVWDGDDPVAYVISKNMHRRHLTLAQKAAIAVEAEHLYEKAARDRVLAAQNNAAGRAARANLPTLEKGRALDHAAKAIGVSRRSAQDAKKVKELNPEAFEKMKQGKESVRGGLKAVGHDKGPRGGRSPNSTKGSTTPKPQAKERSAVSESAAALARIRVRDAELKYQSMLNAPEGKLNIPLLDRASKIQELLLEVTGLTPEKAVSGIPAVRCREYSLEMAQWWLRFAELCDERRRTETPELPPLYKRSRLATLNPVVGPVVRISMTPSMEAIRDWMTVHTDPVTTIEAAVATRINKTTAARALRELTSLGVVEFLGAVSLEAGGKVNVYQLKQQAEGGPDGTPLQ